MPRTLPGNRLLISHSSRALLHSCARKFEFRKFYEHPGYEDSLAADVGNALHKGFQHYLVHRDEERAILEYMMAYPLHLCDSPFNDRSLEAGYATLAAMINSTPMFHYELAMVNCIDGVTRPAVEVAFQIDIEGYSLQDDCIVPVSFTGYIDCILYDPANDEYIVVDIKTTQRKLADLTPMYEFSEQPIPYGLVLEYMLGKEVTGFEVKYLSANIDIVNPNIQLYPFHKSNLDIQDWFRGLLVDLAQIKMFMSMDWFPRSGGGTTCLAWNKRCKFYDICTSRDSNVIQQIILNGKEEQKKLQDEALWSKTGREEWKPWVQFKLDVPQA